MKYGLIGNFGHSNLGDEAILRGMVSLLEAHDKDFIVYSDNISNSKEMFGSENYFYLLRPTYKKNLLSILEIVVQLFRSVIRVDVVIIGGGGLFNQINRTSFYQYLFIMLIATLSFKKLIVVGVSVGPLKSIWYKNLLRLLSLKADFVLTRDSNSLSYFSNKNKMLIPDLSLGFSNVELSKSNGCKSLGVSVMDVTNSLSTEMHEQYKNKISSVIVDVINASLFEEVVLFGMDRDKDLHVAHEIISKLPSEVKRRVKIVELKNLKEVDSFFKSIDFVVGTRLHASILSILYTKVFLAVSYQDKVLDYFETNDFKENTITFLDFINTDVVKRIARLNVQTELDKIIKKKAIAYSELLKKFKGIL